MRQRLIPLIVAAIAAAFFFAPIALRAVGVKAVCCPENRPFAPSPKLADGWLAFDDTTRFLIDRMPGRQQAVRANTWIDQHLFASTPDYRHNGIGGVADDQALPFTGRPDQDKTGLNAIQPTSSRQPPTLIGDLSPVADGKHGWVYLEHDFDHACHFYIPLNGAMAKWRSFVDMVRASGRRVVLVVVADKSTIYPENVEAGTPDLKCSVPGKAKLWATVDAAHQRDAGVIGLRSPLRAAKAAAGAVPIYYPKDSHWNSVGALTLPEQVVPTLDPKIHVLPSEIVNTGPMKHVGDLTALIGNPQTDLAPTRAIRRAPGAPVIPGPSVLLGDSFSDAAYPLLRPYFADLRRAQWDMPPGNIVAQINRAHTVVLEVVEWQFDYYPSQFGVINPTVQRYVKERLTRG